eukprot:TRINITY_DN3984_c0_g1_i1.p1 TRINITY_DN3984_c0_g1~~TRINITY_DN3984_c0_g1_i1.p1  ORF type:complete len:614 (+),score=199.56 TRINITY_DN3984_c0_g1_i1:52-1842(+)
MAGPERVHPALLAVGASLCGALAGACLAQRAGVSARRAEQRAKLFQAMVVEAGRAEGLQATMECILNKACALVMCQRSSLFIVDKERSALRPYILLGMQTSEIPRIPQSQGIAGYVSRTGTVLNVADAYTCPHFNRGYDETTGFKTKAVLCLPIYSAAKDPAHRDIIGVLQMLNKESGGRDAVFTTDDQCDLEELALLASVFLWRSSAEEYKQWAENEANSLIRSMAALKPSASGSQLRESFTVQGTTSMPEVPDASSVAAYMAMKPSAEQLRALRSISDFDVLEYFSTPPLDPTKGTVAPGVPCGAQLIPLFTAMWDDLGFTEAFGVDKAVQMKLALCLRKMMRSVPYHNFAHAFDVTHAVYGFLTKGGLAKVLDKEEQLALFLAAMFHDSDHPGLNNQFHLRSKHPSSILLEATSGSQVESVLEIHHCNVAIAVVTELGLFDHSTISLEAAQRIWQNIITVILATDMKHHGAFVDKAKGLTMQPKHLWSNSLLLELLMKTADISNVSKPFAQANKWGTLVQEEFFTQGDTERELGLEVAPLFDRAAAAKGGASTAGFVKFCALPYFEAVVKVFPSLEYVAQQTRENLAVWEAAA